MKTVRDVCNHIGSVIKKNPICVETGCTYVVDRENLVHTTTNNIFDYIVKSNGGFLCSLDIDEEHIEIALNLVLSGCVDNLYSCWFMLGNSVASMKKLCGFLKACGGDVDVLWLDSKEFDEDYMVNEYNAIKPVLADKHFVLVDDIHNPNSVKYKKMVPILKSIGYNCKEIFTPTGLFMASLGYSLGD
jgi:hypothetical protein